MKKAPLLVLALVSACSDQAPVAPVAFVFQCNIPSYPSAPQPDAVAGNYKYYTYGWQSDPQICVNTYTGVNATSKALITEVLEAGATHLGLLVPINTYAWHHGLSDFSQVLKDWSALKLSTTLEPSDFVAAAGIDNNNLHNGGIIEITQGVFDHSYPGEGRKIIYHQFFHIHQNSHKYYFEAQNNFGISPERQEGALAPDLVGPVWLEEGGAEFAAIYLSAQQGWIDYVAYMTRSLDEARAVIADAATRDDTVHLKDYEIGDTIQLYESDENPTGVSRKWAYQYSGGTWAFAYLTHLRSENLEGILINYWRDLAELEKANQGEGYRAAFQQTFGMSLEDLYTDFDAFMRLPRTEQLAILED